MPNTLLLLSSLRFLKRHRWQTWLTLIGIMLGVAMVVGVDLANSSARRAFALSLESITGPITHQIIGGPRGIHEQVYTRLRTELAIKSSMPLVTGQVSINGQKFTLLGIDPITEANNNRHTAGLEFQGLSKTFSIDNAVMISKRAAENLSLSLSDIVEMKVGEQSHTVQLTAIFPSDNPAATEGLLFADIAIAQRLLNRFGKLDRIDLTVNSSTAKIIEHWLPPGLRLNTSKSRNDNLRQMSEAFHINLTAMSLLALLVAALLIYNTVTLSVIQRRNTLGIFRSIGVTRREIFTLIIKETLVVAIVASLAGLLLGVLLGHALVQLVTRTVNDLYFNLHVSAFLFNPISLVKGFAVGLGTSLIACSIPAWEASKSQPITVMQRSVLERHWKKRLPKLGFTGIVLLLIGFVMLLPSYGTLAEGFIALTFIVIGFCLLVPILLVISTSLILSIFKRFLPSIARIAIRDISTGISRTGMAVAALTVAISVTVGVGVMVNSFRETVNSWLEQYLSADIYISSMDRSSAGLNSSLIENLALLPEVKSVSPSRMTSIETEFGPIRLLAVTPTDIVSSLPLKRAVKNATDLFSQSKGVMISEPLAYHHQLNEGDQLIVTTERGEEHLQVLGIYYDYTSSAGMITINRKQYQQLWRDDKISGISIYRKKDFDQNTLLKSVKKILVTNGENLRANSNSEIRAVAIEVFNRTFEITSILRILAILVAFVGVLSALMALQLERTREFAIMRATGMTARQVTIMILGQTGLMGLLAGLFSIPLGLLMADILIEVINRRSFGWSMVQQVPSGVLTEALLLAIVAAVLAGVYPAIKASSTSPAQALREE